jgi:hypothetical protein
MEYIRRLIGHDPVLTDAELLQFEAYNDDAKKYFASRNTKNVVWVLLNLSMLLYNAYLTSVAFNSCAAGDVQVVVVLRYVIMSMMLLFSLVLAHRTAKNPERIWEYSTVYLSLYITQGVFILIPYDTIFHNETLDISCPYAYGFMIQSVPNLLLLLPVIRSVVYTIYYKYTCKEAQLLNAIINIIYIPYFMLVFGILINIVQYFTEHGNAKQILRLYIGVLTGLFITEIILKIFKKTHKLASYLSTVIMIIFMVMCGDCGKLLNPTFIAVNVFMIGGIISDFIFTYNLADKKTPILGMHEMSDR